MKDRSPHFDQLRFGFTNPGLFVDFHGTLSATQFWSNLPDARLRKTLREFLFSSRLDLAGYWMRGSITSERITEVICDTFALEHEVLWRKFETHSQRIPISGLSQLRRLRQHFNVALVTVNVDTFTKITAQSRKLYSFFDAVVNSADFDALKDASPNSLFRYAELMAGTEIKNSLLLDDSEKACVAFRELGGLAFQVNNVSQTLEILDVLIKLSEHNPDKLTALTAYNVLKDVISTSN